MLLQLSRLTAILRSYAAELWSRRWTIMALMWLTSLAGLGGLMLLPDYFTARARFYVDTRTLLEPLLRGLTVESHIDQQAELVRKTLLTRPNMERTIHATGLDRGMTTPAELEALVQKLTRNIEFTSDGREVFTLGYSGESAKQAVAVVQTLLDIFVEQNVNSSQQDITESRQFIDKQVADYERRLREIEDRVTQFRRDHGADLATKQNLVTQLQTAEGGLRQSETELQAALLSREQLRMELARTPQTVSASQAQAAAGQAGSQETRLRDMKEQLAFLLLHNTEKHPDIINLRKQIAVLEAGQRGLPASPSASSNQVPNPTHAELSAQVRRVELQIATLKRQIETLRKDTAEMRERLSALPALEMASAQLDRDYQVLRNTYSELIGRRETARMAQQVEEHSRETSFKLVEPPVEPVRPTGPPRKLYTLLVAFGALGVGVGISLLQIQMRDTFSSLSQIRDAFDLPVLGSVSRIGGAQARPGRVLVFAVVALALVSLYGGTLQVFSQDGLRAQIVGGVRGYLTFDTETRPSGV